MSAQDNIRRLVAHHSSAWEKDSHGDLRLPTLESLIRKHTLPEPDGNGWSDVGYHWVIDRLGTIHVCRPITKQPAAHKPHNAGSLAVCAIGWNGREGFPHWGWTDVQKSALQRVLDSCRGLFGDDLEWCGHRDLRQTSTLCPGLNVRELLR